LANALYSRPDAVTIELLSGRSNWQQSKPIKPLRD
jgi:hypothetical protein